MAKKIPSEKNKPGTLRVLMVEDSEDDVLLIIRELKRGGYNPVYEWVETATAMKNALQEKQWNIILCDYKLPKFNAPSAIAVLKETNIDIPLLIVSGSIGEETAVECMRLGAQDYIMKDNLSRLCPAIERELKEAESRVQGKRAESQREAALEALHQSEEKYRTILENIEDGYYEVDLNGNFTFFNASMCRTLGYPPEEMMGMNNRQFTDRENAKKLFKTFNEIYRTGEPAKEFDWQIIRKDGTERYIEVSVSLQKNSSGKPIGFRGISRDITERKQSFERMKKALRATVQAISLTVEMKDPYTSGHQQRVSDLARSMAIEMGLSADRQEFIRTASTIHDIGKIAIPTEILSKPTKLTALEFNLIKAHPQLGYDILKDIEFPWPVADVVLQHHERMDGSGYPQGLKGDDILLEARILAIADVVEAIAFHRPYRPAIGINLALEEISRNKGILYDADAVDACLKLFREKGYSLVLKKQMESRRRSILEIREA